MAIYEAEPIFSRHEKRLLILLSKLMLEFLERNSLTNMPTDEVLLTDDEARELAELLDQLINSKEFAEKAYFVEAATHKNFLYDRTAREIYLARRKQRGRSRAMASTHWNRFVDRLQPGRAFIPGSHSGLMSFDYFLNMEKKLFESIQLDARIVNHVIRQIKETQSNVDNARSGKSPFENGFIQSALRRIIKRDNSKKNVSPSEHRVAVDRISAVLTIISNSSVLFSTRDWGVAGTISTMSGSLSLGLWKK